MSSAAEMQLLYRVANAPVHHFPFPHMYVRDVFPDAFYRALRENLPSPDACRTLTSLGRVSDGYPESRLVFPLETQNIAGLPEPARRFWQDLAKWLRGQEFGSMMLGRFAPYLEQRFGAAYTQEFTNEALLVQDYTTYRLPPHTDSPQKVLALLFYLPPDDRLSHLGTSIYLPKERGFVCEGHTHHPPEAFDRLMTMPYAPNSLFAFFKTSSSFHGVEPIVEKGVRRDLLLYDIRVHRPSLAESAPAAASANVQFTF